MLNASETAAAAQASAAVATGTKSEAADPDLFAQELGARVAAGVDKMAAAMEKLAAAFPGVTVSVKSTTTIAEARKTSGAEGDGFSLNVSSEMMAALAEDDAAFAKMRELVSSLFSAGKEQKLVDVGSSSTHRNVSVETNEIKYVEVQRDAKGAQMSVSSLALANMQLISETLDKLLAARQTGTQTTNGARTNANWGFAGFLSSSSEWRLESFVSAGSMERFSGNWSGGFQANTLMRASVNVNLEVLVEEWGAAGGSGTDLIAYIEEMGLCDPLVLDLGDEGFNLRSAEDGVYFDIKGDGSPVRTAFIQGNNAFLYLDQNDNGVADDVSELFGDHGGFANGFDMLAQYDDNGDGVIDANDAVYSQLRLWRDLNGDGVNQADESMSLAEAGVKSINLGYEDKKEKDAHGNVIGERSTFTRTDGRTGQVADVWLRNT